MGEGEKIRQREVDLERRFEREGRSRRTRWRTCPQPRTTSRSAPKARRCCREEASARRRRGEEVKVSDLSDRKRREEDGSATHKAYDSQKAPYELKAVAAKVFLRANDERQPTVERSGRTARAAPAQRRRAAPTPDLAGEDRDAPAGKLPHCAR